jgi:hypothetical protein
MDELSEIVFAISGGAAHVHPMVMFDQVDSKQSDEREVNEPDMHLAGGHVAKGGLDVSSSGPSAAPSSNFGHVHAFATAMAMPDTVPDEVEFQPAGHHDDVPVDSQSMSGGSELTDLLQFEMNDDHHPSNIVADHSGELSDETLIVAWDATVDHSAPSGASQQPSAAPVSTSEVAGSHVAASPSLRVIPVADSVAGGSSVDRRLVARVAQDPIDAVFAADAVPGVEGTQSGPAGPVRELSLPVVAIEARGEASRVVDSDLTGRSGRRPLVAAAIVAGTTVAAVALERRAAKLAWAT